MRYVIAWVEDYEGSKEILQATEEAVPAMALVANLMADEKVSQITVMAEESNGRAEA